MGARDGPTRFGDSSGCDTVSQPKAGDSQPETSLSSAEGPIFLMEVLSDATAKRLFKIFYAGIGLAGVMLLAFVGMKQSKRFEDQVSLRRVAIFSWVVSAIDFAMLAVCMLVFIWRLRAVRVAGLRWDVRRWRWTVIFAAQLLSGATGGGFLVTANLGILAGELDFGDTYSWFGLLWFGTAHNTFMALVAVQARSFNLIVDKAGRPVGTREDALWLDAPWRSHWFIGVYWCILEGALLWLYIKMQESFQDSSSTENHCSPPPEATICMFFVVSVLVGYMLLYLYFMRRAFMLFSRRSYVEFRWENIYLRFTFRMVGVTLLFGVLSNISLWFIQIDSCLGLTLASFGFPPVVLVLSLQAVLNTILVLPTFADNNFLIGLMPEGPLWQEKLGNHTRDGDFQDGVVGPESQFCFETAVKLIYWCESIYEYDPGTAQFALPWDLDTGMALYDFTHHEYLTAKGSDVHALIAWNDFGTILLCFRGTYSVANVMVDIKVWRAAHPAAAHGMFWLGTCPMVHKGFLNAWTGENFEGMVLAKLKEVMESTGFNKQNLQILVSGHSLGGALAVLAANAIAREHKVEPWRLSCYTFGCPRVGNGLFATEHDKLVPNTWHIMNDLDPIPRMAKFWVLYKRSGKRVIVNDRGDMIISPMFLEFKLSSAFFGKRKIMDHKLAGYRKSLLHFAAAQFHKYKCFPGGLEALKALCIKGDIMKVLTVGRGSVDNLSALASRLWGRPLHRCGCNQVLEDGTAI